MHLNTIIPVLPFLALASQGAPVEDITKRAASNSCPLYTIINTRGTGERQGPSAGFTVMNKNILSRISGGKQYNTVYPASFSQVSTKGTEDIVNKVKSLLASNSEECIILQGYSQGAAATVNALSKLTGAQFDAVKGVFLLGNPNHKKGLACNVDNNGGDSTKDASGLSASSSSGIPNSWIDKTQDVCKKGDGVCDTANGSGINAAHLSYPSDSGTQNLGTSFILKQLGGF